MLQATRHGGAYVDLGVEGIPFLSPGVKRLQRHQDACSGGAASEGSSAASEDNGERVEAGRQDV